MALVEELASLLQLSEIEPKDRHTKLHSVSASRRKGRTFNLLSRNYARDRMILSYVLKRNRLTRSARGGNVVLSGSETLTEIKILINVPKAEETASA
jgi:hypothetical protein